MTAGAPEAAAAAPAGGSPLPPPLAPPMSASGWVAAASSSVRLSKSRCAASCASLAAGSSVRRASRASFSDASLSVSWVMYSRFFWTETVRRLYFPCASSQVLRSWPSDWGPAAPVPPSPPVAEPAWDAAGAAASEAGGAGGDLGVEAGQAGADAVLDHLAEDLNRGRVEARLEAHVL